MVYIGIFVVGLMLGGLITIVTLRRRSIGTLRVDESDPDDGPYLFLELEKSCPPEVIKRKKYVTLKVNVENYISHE